MSNRDHRCSADGTLGQRLVNGEKQVRLFVEEQPVGAGVHTIGGLFAHADCDALRIGQRVMVRFQPSEGGPPLPVFVPV